MRASRTTRTRRTKRAHNVPIVAIIATAVVALAVVFFAVSRFLPGGIAVGAAGSTSPNAQATPIHHYGAEDGSIATTLISPDNVSLQIVQVVKTPAAWFFHIHAHDNAKSGVAILSASTSHFFMLGLRGTGHGPYTASQLDVMLAPPAQAELAARPSLPTNVSPGGDVDGWLMADLSHTTFPPFQLFYVYGTVTAPACANPSDQSTCHPAVGYRTLVWDL